MLPLEKQVTSKSISEKLWELGIPQKSLFYWITFSQTAPMLARGENPQKPKIIPAHQAKKVLSGNKHLYSAFTASEVEQWLSTKFTTVKRVDGKFWVVEEEEREETCECCEEPFYLLKDELIAHTEADARGLMLIHLIEAGHLDPKTL